MANARIELNRRSVRDLLRSDGIRADLEARAKRVAAAAGPGHRVDVAVGPNRARAAVITDSIEARHREATSRSLTRAVNAGRSR